MFAFRVAQWFPPTDWVFAKAGENLLNFLLKTELSKKLFSFFKLTKFLENEKVFLRQKKWNSCIKNFMPVFANTMLGAVFLVRRLEFNLFKFQSEK